MTTRVIENAQDRAALIKLIESRDLPITVSILKGKHRTEQQNRLQRMWINEAAEQLKDESAEDKRAYCKLHFGIPILRNGDEAFQSIYDRAIRPLEYDLKLEMMKVPVDFPVTRLMTTKQKHEYLNQMEQHFLNQGVNLTEPESR
jgi:hypothetical protein